MKPHHGPPRRPTIAITPDVATPADSPLPRYELKCAYVDAVLRAGGLPWIVPMSDDRQVIDAVLDRVSGLVITGGAFDVPPDLYGETPREGLGPLKPARTASELAYLKGALAKHVPVLGICGGMQLINVAFQGTLHQDLSRELPTAKSHEQSHDRTQPHHPIDVRDGTILADCVGRGQLMVNSTHHQAVKTLGAGLVASAFAGDGVIEALEARTPTWVLGVQWHPELMIESIPANLGVYRTLVTKARERRHG